MKGKLTSIALQDRIPMAMIHIFIDSLISESEEVFTNYHHSFNEQGEFIYRVSNSAGDWGCEKFKMIEMVVNDEGVFVNGNLHEDFTSRFLNILERYLEEEKTLNI